MAKGGCWSSEIGFPSGCALEAASVSFWMSDVWEDRCFDEEGDELCWFTDGEVEAGGVWIWPGNAFKLSCLLSMMSSSVKSFKDISWRLFDNEGVSLRECSGICKVTHLEAPDRLVWGGFGSIWICLRLIVRTGVLVEIFIILLKWNVSKLQASRKILRGLTCTLALNFPKVTSRSDWEEFSVELPCSEVSLKSS